MTRSLLLAFLAGLVLAACQEETAPPPPVRPILSSRVAIDAADQQSFVGTVEARDKVDLGFQVLGRLLTRTVDVGDTVRSGEVIATIDATTLDLAVRSAEAALGNRRAERENAAATVTRVEALRASGTAAEASLEDARTAYDAADAAVRQAEADLAKARDALGYAELRAGFDGIVTATGAEPGQTVAAGESIVTIAKPDPRDAVIDVPDWLVSTLPPAAPFVVAPQIAPDQPILGRLREIAPDADPLTRTRRLKIALSEPPSLFRLGTTVEVRADRQASPNITLPETAILTRDGEAFVWVVSVDETSTAPRREGTVALRKVATAPADQGRLRIVSGLSAGERVAIAGVHSLQDGQQVIVPADGPGGTEGDAL
ncbi:efflux RND transporter periplasmic adaptor subunit [Pleomorphomonas sp. NRK KF1]|uniref:efflux RND transporter periplasmic adaptor subunit n=1 Tax=Pleomorphomonas sp. NRK KF1 TaxID=2943000 RepID=UPI002043F513|nr:efflux RND transporter periplasmic adaptor subunit [Pleomorphomonas sp. NRK KF1]MCM5554251.1 efflux RND transporter periplasmic adaptor subunit [Pleomorphomonas sp. NRK KF1]